MKGTLIDKLKKDPDEMRFFQQEMFILEVTELICELMAQKNIKKSELAQRLGRTKGYITQLLDGRANMTLRTISDIFWAMDSTVNVSARPIEFQATDTEDIYEIESPMDQFSEDIEITKQDSKMEYKLAG